MPCTHDQITFDSLQENYEAFVRTFYKYLPSHVIEIFVNDALYHKARYLDMLRQDLCGQVLEIGSDKPFITHCLRTLYQNITVNTISMDIPYSPYPIERVDIESEPLPYPENSMDWVIFTEVLEHLFRNPAWAIFQINKVLRMDGTLFLTTPNACGYDVLQNILMQKNPNERNQFYQNIESGHPHLWTAGECTELLENHGFSILSIETADYYEIPMISGIGDVISGLSVNRDLHGQALKIIAKKQAHSNGPIYSKLLFPDGTPVQFSGALKKWITQH